MTWSFVSCNPSSNRFIEPQTQKFEKGTTLDSLIRNPVGWLSELVQRAAELAKPDKGAACYTLGEEWLGMAGGRLFMGQFKAIMRESTLKMGWPALN